MTDPNQSYVNYMAEKATQAAANNSLLTVQRANLNANSALTIATEARKIVNAASIEIDVLKHGMAALVNETEIISQKEIILEDKVANLITITNPLITSQASGLILATPASTSGIPAFRRLAISDLPNGGGGMWSGYVIKTAAWSPALTDMGTLVNLQNLYSMTWNPAALISAGISVGNTFFVTGLNLSQITFNSNVSYSYFNPVNGYNRGFSLPTAVTQANVSTWIFTVKAIVGSAITFQLDALTSPILYSSVVSPPLANQMSYLGDNGITRYISAPVSAGSILTWNGTGFVWSAVGVSGLNITSSNIGNYAPGLTGIGATGTWNIGVSGNAVGLFGGEANRIPYQTSANHTAFIPAPTAAGTTLTWNGSVFSWIPGGGGGITTSNIGNYAPSLAGVGATGTWNINISGIALEATYAVNINGGTLNEIPYQTATGVTSWINAPTQANMSLQWNGSAFVWAPLGAISATANIAAGLANELVYQTGVGATGFIVAPTASGTYLEWNGTNFVWNAVSGSGSSGALSGGAANQIVYQTGVGITDFIVAPTVTSSYLEWDGTNFVWGNPAPDLSNVLTTSNYGTYALPMSGGTLTGGLNVTGAIVATGDITAFSDERLKKNWRTVTKNFVTKLANVKSGVFDRTDNSLTQVGVSAQSLREIMPEAIKLSFGDTLSVNYGGAAMVSAVELAKEVVSLKELVADLTKRLAELANIVYQNK